MFIPKNCQVWCAFAAICQKYEFLSTFSLFYRHSPTIFFLVPFAKLLGGGGINRKPQNKRVFFHALCILLNRNTVRHLHANLQCRLSSYLWPKSLRCVQADHFKLFLSVFFLLLVEECELELKITPVQYWSSHNTIRRKPGVTLYSRI